MSNLPNIWKWKFGDSISGVEWLMYSLTTDGFDPIARNSHSTKVDWNDRFFCAWFDINSIMNWEIYVANISSWIVGKNYQNTWQAGMLTFLNFLKKNYITQNRKQLYINWCKNIFVFITVRAVSFCWSDSSYPWFLLLMWFWGCYLYTCPVERWSFCLS